MSFLNTTQYWYHQALVVSAKLVQQTENERAIVCEGIPFYQQWDGQAWDEDSGVYTIEYGYFFYPKPSPYNKIMLFFLYNPTVAVANMLINVDYQLWNDLCPGSPHNPTMAADWTALDNFTIAPGTPQYISTCHDLTTAMRGHLVKIRLRHTGAVPPLDTPASRESMGWLIRSEYGVDPDYDGPRTTP